MPPELEPLPLVPEPPLPEADVPPEAAAPLDEAGATLLGADAAVVVLLGVEEVVDVELVDTPAAADAPVGTVSGGAPDVLAELELPPPQAAIPVAKAAAAAIAATEREREGKPPRPGTTWDRGRIEPRKRTGRASVAERIHPTPAVRTIVQVLLGELVAPIAKAQIVDGPGKLGPGWRERQQLRHHLERLARLTIYVLDARLGLNDHFTTGGWRPHTVLLADPHPAPCYQRPRQGRGAGRSPSTGAPLRRALG